MGGMFSSAAAGAAAGSVFGPVGTAVGAIGGGIYGIFSGYFGKKQEMSDDTRAMNRENTLYGLQLAEAKGQRDTAITGYEARQDINTNQASRYMDRQNVLATQTVAGAERQMTMLGLSSMMQNMQANQQLFGSYIQRSYDVGNARQAAAVSGFRGGGSTDNLERSIDTQYSRQISSQRRQIQLQRQSVTLQLKDARITSTQAAEQLRYQGREQIRQANERNSLLDLDITAARKDYQSTKTVLNKKIGWNNEEIKWLEDNEGGLLAVATLF